MTLYRKGKTPKSIVIILLSILIIYLLPALTKSNNSILSSFDTSHPEFSLVFFRSILFALVNSFLCILVGLWIAFKIIKIGLFSNIGKAFSLLIIPFLLGSTSIAFIFKMLLLHSNLMGWAYERSINLFAILTLIQFWQFGTLFSYLFWLSLKSINSNSNQYATAAKMSKWEYFKDICIPNLENLIILLTFICFIYSFYEDVKISLIFRVSEGLNAELISHWITRNYQSDILIGYNYALHKMATVSIDTLLTIGVSFMLFAVLILILIRKLKQSHIIFSKSKLWINKSSRFTLTSIILLLVVIMPLVIVFKTNKISFDRIYFLILPLTLSILGAILASTIAIVFSFFARLMNFEKMGSFNFFSFFYLMCLFIILLIPPLEIMLGGFEWMNLLKLNGFYSSVVFWLVGHTFLSLPILGSFLLVTNFKISSNELNYCKIYNISQKDIFKTNFFKKFKAEYLLALLFAYTVILNEGLLNKVFSDKIPSFVSALNDSISTKNADYSLSMLFFLVSIIVASASIGIWIYSMKKYQNEKNIA
jgi:ABC-type Fe3+ transport system permease subunit